MSTQRSLHALLLSSLLLALSSPADTEGPYTYTVVDGKATITEVDRSYSGALCISETIGEHPVISIGEYAFARCFSLKSVTIPASVTNIGDDAFSFCSSLTNITVHSDNPAYASLNGVLFNKDFSVLMQYSGGLSGDYTIPASVTSIADGAFPDDSSRTSPTSITIPSSGPVISIDFSKKPETLPPEFNYMYESIKQYLLEDKKEAPGN